MKTFSLTTESKKTILALGAESAGNFSVFYNNKINFSEDFGDLLDDKSYSIFQKAVLEFLKNNKLTPNVILTDLHPEYRTTLWGEKLAKKFKAKKIQVQHHVAHIFSSINNDAPDDFIGVALDGTGYGLDEKIWGGEVFLIESRKSKVERIGHLENQIMIGGDLSIREPARMLISILSKFLNKDEVHSYTKKFYNNNQFELLFNQLEQKFNCQETSSAGRVLDAVSVLLEFSENERKFKHAPIDSLEKNSTTPFTDLKPIIKNNILLTTPLFEYLVKNLKKDKKRLAATAQLYIAQGMHEIVKNIKTIKYTSGGISNNKIISSHLESKGLIANKKIPRGDAGLSFGQISYYLLTNSRD